MINDLLEIDGGNQMKMGHVMRFQPSDVKWHRSARMRALNEHFVALFDSNCDRGIIDMIDQKGFVKKKWGSQRFPRVMSWKRSAWPSLDESAQQSTQDQPEEIACLRRKLLQSQKSKSS